MRVDSRFEGRVLLGASVLVATLALATLAGCPLSQTSFGVRPPPGTSAAVYAAGSYFNGSAVNVACYWVNGGAETDLTGTGITSTNDSYATAIFVSGGTVYAAGYYYSSTASAYVGCYWVNGSKTDLPGTGANVYSIFVSGGTVYTAGYYHNGTKNVACYWTGTTRSADMPCSSATAPSFANSIYVVGNTVYLVGQDNFATAAYWTQTGTSTPTEVLLNSNGLSSANSIVVANGTVYIAGQDTNTSSTQIAVYWTGSTSAISSSTASTPLSGGNGASANSIAVSGSTIYMAGQYNITSASTTACYWTATTSPSGPFNLPGTNGDATSIYVSGTTAYAAGYYFNTTTLKIGSYWTISGNTISGPTNLLGATSTENAQAYSIFAQ